MYSLFSMYTGVSLFSVVNVRGVDSVHGRVDGCVDGFVGGCFPGRVHGHVHS